MKAWLEANVVGALDSTYFIRLTLSLHVSDSIRVDHLVTEGSVGQVRSLRDVEDFLDGRLGQLS